MGADKPRSAARTGHLAAAVLGASCPKRRGFRRMRVVLLDQPGQAWIGSASEGLAVFVMASGWRRFAVGCAFFAPLCRGGGGGTVRRSAPYACLLITVSIAPISAVRDVDVLVGSAAIASAARTSTSTSSVSARAISSFTRVSNLKLSFSAFYLLLLFPRRLLDA